MKVKKSNSKKKSKRVPDGGDSSTPIESDNEGVDGEVFDRKKEGIFKTEKLSSHLNTVREKYKKQRASLIKESDPDDLGQFILADNVTFASLLVERIK